MSTDDRYKLVKPMIDTDHIKSFRDIFTYLPKTVIAKDLGINNGRFTDLISHPEGLRVGDVYRLAALFNIEPRQIFELIESEINQAHLNKGKTEK
jgi:hypothetical protein